MKAHVMLLLAISLVTSPLLAQDKPLVYGELGYGFGQTLFHSSMPELLRYSLGGSFSPGTGNNLMAGFLWTPQRLPQLGLGARVKGTFGSSVKGELNSTYIFNYYTVGLQARYHPFSQAFNRGWFARGAFGFGQMTTKRVQEASNVYVHQYAIGTTLAASVGYSFPLKRSAILVELEYESSRRNGTISGKGDGQVFRSGQIGGQVTYSF